MELRDRRALAAELVLGALPFAGALACMALCLPSADAAPPVPPEMHAMSFAAWQPCAPRGCTAEMPMAWILVRGDRIELGLTRVWPPFTRTIARGARGDLEADLASLHADYMADRTDIEIAVESTDDAPISYQELVTAIDTAMHAGFVDVRLDPPQKLPDQPHHCDPEPSPDLHVEPEVLIADDEIVVGVPGFDTMPIYRDASDPDAAWRELEGDLRWLHDSYAGDQATIQLARSDDGMRTVTAVDLVPATAAARAAGFSFVSVRN